VGLTQMSVDGKGWNYGEGEEEGTRRGFAPE